MRNIGKGMFLLALLSAGLVSCSDDSPWRGSETEGGIILNFSSDARVMRQTRADDSTSPLVPDNSQFAVQIVKSDGSYSQRWTGIESFNRESGFPIGEYTLTASYGSLEQEGFQNPYYLGSTPVHVSPGATTEANIVATLANSMVSVRYTDEFRETFPTYSAAVQSAGHEQVVFTQTETRPAYVSPSRVKLNLTLTNQSNQQVTIQPAEFTAQPRHHYVITVGVEGLPNGSLALDVQFDDDVVSETVEVPLGDELFTAPAPSLKSLGFTDGENLSTIEYTPRTTKTAFDIFAFGGLRSVSLTVVSDGYTPAFGRTVELVNANATIQQQLKDAGVDCAGLFRNVDKMAQVNVTDFLGKLPAGDYTVEVQAVDMMTRTTGPMSFAYSVEPLVLELTAPENVEFFGNSVSVTLNTNNPAVKDLVKFKVPNANNQMVDATIQSVQEVQPAAGSNTRSAEMHAYRYVLGLTPQVRNSIEVSAKIYDITKSINVPMQMPTYSFTPDAYARKVVIKLNVDDASKTGAIMDNLVLFNGNTVVPTTNVSMADGFITIVGLTPGTTYSNLKAKLGTSEQSVPAFTTETEADVPNGDFAQLNAAITFNKIDVGGQYNVTFFGISDNYQNYSSISYQEPTGWATVNENTCWAGSNPLNSWFIVPSTYASSGSVLLRSVGYNHNGTVPARSGGNNNTRYYCENSPADSDLEKAAGELFLGSYSFDGSEHRVNGVAFASRPSTLSFDYTYEPLAGSGEKGEVLVRLLAADNTVIFEKREALNAADLMKSHTINLSGYPFGKKAAKIEVAFRSTQTGVTPQVHIPTGTALNEGIINIRGNRTIATNAYKALATGSKLTVDNVKLGYETSNSVNSKPAKKNRK